MILKDSLLQKRRTMTITLSVKRRRAMNNISDSVEKKLTQNCVLIGGKFAKDPIFSIAKNNREYCSFSIVWHPGKADASFFNVICWDKKINEKLRNEKKGNELTVVGPLIQNRWTDDEGQNRQSVNICVEHVDTAQISQDFKPSDFNSVVITGKINSKSEYKNEKGLKSTDTSIANLSASENKDNPYSYFHLASYGVTADYLNRMSSGDFIRAVGKLKQDRWVSEGQEKSSVKIIGEYIDCLSRGQETELSQKQNKKIENTNELGR